MDIRRFVRFAAGLALALGLLLAPLAAPALAGDASEEKAERVPILWEVQTKPPIYLFGTIHVADERVTTHPPVVLKALENSKALYTELDFANMGGAEMVKHVIIPDGKSLGDIASPETMEKLKQVAERYELPPMQMMQFQRLRPWLSAVQLPVLVNTKRKAEEVAKAAAAAKAAGETESETKPEAPGAEQALDLQLYMGAKQAGKLVGGLEKPVEQFSIFNKITLEKQVEMLDESLDAILELDKPSEGEGSGEEKVDPIEGLIRMYVKADLDGFYAMMQESMGDNAEMKAFMVELLDNRNITMVRRMMEAAEKHPDKPMFVAVGAGHYPGKMGIIQLLEETGFRVRPLRNLEDMAKPWPKIGARETSSRAKPCCRPCCPPRPVAAPGY